MSSISVKYISPELLSGSDQLRTSLEQAWEVVESDAGTTYEFNGNIDYDGGIAHTLTSVESNPDLMEDVDVNSLLRAYKMPIRIKGNSDYITEDAQWKTYILGGVYDEISYKGLFYGAVFQDYYFSCELPYGKYEAAVLSTYDDPGYQTISINPVYNYYLPLYQRHIDTEEQHLIPNIYFYQLAVDSSDPENDIPEEVINYITREGQLNESWGYPDSGLSNLFEPTVHQMLPPEESLYLGIDDDGDSGVDYMVDRNYNLRSYLTSSYLAISISGSTGTRIRSMVQNLIFDDSAAHSLLKEDASILTNRDLFPYYVDIKIPIIKSYSEDATIFRTLLKSHKFVQVLMLKLKDVFAFSAASTATTDTMSMLTNKEYYEGEEGSSIISHIKESSASAYRSKDFVKLLSEIYEDPNTSDNYVFMKQHTYEVKAAAATTPPARYSVTSKVLKVLFECIGYLSENYGEEFFESLNKIYEQAENSKYYEVLAYRVEKTAASAPAGSPPLQNFWVFNDQDLEDFISLTDSQVAYGKDYVYSVYAYKLVVGHKYLFSDLVLTRQISEPIEIDGESSKYCLEFFDPDTNIVSEQLFETEDEIADTNIFASNAQITDENQFLADFMLNYEPGVKILETKIYSKTIRVLDHPASALDISPFQVLDDSQEIGFAVNYKDFFQTEMPTILNSNDSNYVTNYKKAQDMLINDKVQSSSRSKAQKIEMFRTDKKPNSIQQFANFTYKDYSLAIPDLVGKNVYSVVHCYDTIKTNQKYYYLFRAANQQNISGPPSQIYEVELIDDGGYKYAVFNVLFESDLDINTYIQPSKSFKKLFSLIPHSSHLQFVTDEVDLSGTASEQLGNLQVGASELDDSIWGKTFKIRLISKKTGKKIDLNITYNLESG